MARPRIATTALGAGLATALTLTACSGGEPEVTSTTLPEAAAPASPQEPAETDGDDVDTDAASSDGSPGTELTGTPGEPEDVVTDLAVPWSVAVLDETSALVSLRDEARVVLVTTDGDATPVTATGPDGQVPDVVPQGEGGLLGLALSPDLADDRLVYAYTSTAQDNRVLRMELTDDATALGEPEVVLDSIPVAGTHNGGRIAFGPDGMLYVATGDAQDRAASQDPDSLAGKILRITPDGEVPDDNPTEGSPVWSLGHRNVQGLGWDAQGRMLATEFGQDQLDELNLVEPGGNYGWPEVEGTGGGGDFIDPLVVWSPAEASPSGLLVTGDAAYLASLRGERLWRVPLSAGEGGVTVGEPTAHVDGNGRLRDVVAGPDDALWVLTSNTDRGAGDEDDDRLLRVPLE